MRCIRKAKVDFYADFTSHCGNSQRIFCVKEIKAVVFVKKQQFGWYHGPFRPMLRGVKDFLIVITEVYIYEMDIT